jgi:hypothetical protein
MLGCHMYHMYIHQLHFGLSIALPMATRTGPTVLELGAQCSGIVGPQAIGPIDVRPDPKGRKEHTHCYHRAS